MIRARDAEDTKPVWFKLEKVLGSVVPVPTNAGMDTTTKGPSKKDTVIDVLAQHPEGLAAEKWTELSKAANVGQSTFYKQKAALLNEGAIRQDERGLWFLIPEAERPVDLRDVMEMGADDIA